MLAGLGPGTREVLFDDVTRVAAKAQRAGVDITFSPGAGRVHVWQLFPYLPEAAAALDEVGDFVKRHIP